MQKISKAQTQTIIRVTTVASASIALEERTEAAPGVLNRV